MVSHAISSTGIGLRFVHMPELLSTRADVGFLEAHSENFFGGGLAREQLQQLSRKYPISLHGVGLSLGRADRLDQNHLHQLKRLANEINPVFISEHLSWSAFSHTHTPDLLPLPFIEEALEVFVDHVNAFQDTMGRQILVENPSNYLAFAKLDYTEPEFLNTLVERTQCGLLLDINNIAVSAHNLSYDAKTYINAIADNGSVKQIHLAGYQVNSLSDGSTLYLDTHGMPVDPEVWSLYQHAINRFGCVPTLIEWDNDIPALPVLIAEAHKADSFLNR